MDYREKGRRDLLFEPNTHGKGIRISQKEFDTSNREHPNENPALLGYTDAVILLRATLDPQWNTTNWLPFPT